MSNAMNPRVLKRIACAALLAIMAASLIGCGAFNQAESPESAVAPSAVPLEAPKDMSVTDQYGAAGSEPMADEQRSSAGADAVISADDKYIVTVGSMDMRVDKLDAALTGLKSAVKANGAEISDLSISTGYVDPMAYSEGAAEGPKTAVITMRVPAEKVEALQARIEKLGTLISQSTNANDVTEQVIDLDARLKNLKVEEAQLRELMKRAVKISDVLAVGQELSRVRGEIESMDAQLTYLKRQAAKATLTVSMSEPAPVVSPGGASWGFSEAITNGIRGAVAVVNTIIVAVIALAPVWIVLGIMLWVFMARRRRRAESTTDADEPAETVE